MVRLRESEAGLMTERDSLKATLQILKTTIISAHLPLPPGIIYDDLTESTSLPPAEQSRYDSMPATISYFSDDLEHERLHVSWAGDPTTQTNTQQQPALLPAYVQHTPYQEQTAYLAQKPLPDFPHGRPLICNAGWPGHWSSSRLQPALRLRRSLSCCCYSSVGEASCFCPTPANADKGRKDDGDFARYRYAWDCCRVRASVGASLHGAHTVPGWLGGAGSSKSYDACMFASRLSNFFFFISFVVNPSSSKPYLHILRPKLQHSCTS